SQSPLPFNMSIAGMGWAGFSLLGPLREYFSQGETTTFKSAAEMVANTWHLLPKLKEYESRKEARFYANGNSIQAITRRSIESAQSPAPTQESGASKLLMRRTRTELINQITQARNFDDFRRLRFLEIENMTDEEYLAYYMLLMEDYQDSILINHLIKAIERLRAKLVVGDNRQQTEDQANHLIKRIMKFCGEAVTKVMQVEAEQFPHKYLSKEPSQWTRADLKQYTDLARNCATARDTLRHLYKSLGLIHLDDNDRAMKKKLSYLINMIKYTRNDKYSSWISLRRRNTQKVLFLKSAVRILAAGLWGIVGALVLTGRIEAAAAVPICLVVGGLRGLLNVLAENLTFGNTQQYKEANLICDRVGSIYNLKCENNTRKNKRLHPKITQVINADSPPAVFPQVMDTFHNNELVNKYASRFNSVVAALSGSETAIETATTEATLNTQAVNYVAVYKIVKEMIIECSDTSDKYLCGKSLMHIIASIYHSRLSAESKLDITFLLVTLFETRNLSIAAHLSKEQSYARRCNYFILDIIGGMLFGTSTILGLPDFMIPEFLQLVGGAVGDTIAVLGLSYAAGNSSFGNTRSYQKCMEFLQCTCWYFYEQLESPTPELRKRVGQFLRTNHSRSPFNKITKPKIGKKFLHRET
ncbi:MAG: hypothetical protein ACK4M7_04045, partial [Burkholderiales bacterium]